MSEKKPLTRAEQVRLRRAQQNEKEVRKVATQATKPMVKVTSRTPTVPLSSVQNTKNERRYNIALGSPEFHLNKPKINLPKFSMPRMPHFRANWRMGALILAFVLITALVLAFQLPYFYVPSANVFGNTRISAEEINGIIGGYTGEGFKTVLPAEARAKVSFRLTGHQDPLAIREAFRAHIRAAVPADCTVEFIPHGASPASRMDISDPAFAAAKQALSEEWGRDAAYIGAGGSIPIAGDFKELLGMDSMLIGFARDDDRIHSPNEKYDVNSFAKGARSWARILAALD